MATRSTDQPASRRVLLVDDDERFLRALERFLKTRGFQVMTLTDGSRVLGAVAADSIDVVISDIDMPGVTGMRVSRELPEVLEAVGRVAPPVLMVTAERDFEPTPLIMRKPVDGPALIAAIERATGQSEE